MTFPSFTADQSVYRNTRHNRSSPVIRLSGIIVGQCGNGFLPDGSYLRSCDECTCNDDDLSCYCYDPTKHGKPAKTGPIAVRVHLNDDGRVRAIERSCRAALKRAATRSKAAFTLRGALRPGLSKNELQRRFARMQSPWISRTAAVTAIGLTLLLATGAAAERLECSCIMIEPHCLIFPS